MYIYIRILCFVVDNVGCPLLRFPHMFGGVGGGWTLVGSCPKQSSDMFETTAMLEITAAC